MFQIKVGPIVLMLAIVGCTGSVETTHTGTATPSITSFDGAYRSTIRVTGMSSQAKGKSWCETPGQQIITVANGQFSYPVPHPNYPGNPTPIFSATMAQDGSFSGQANSGTISGQVSGSHIEGSINGVGCIYAFTGDRM